MPPIIRLSYCLRAAQTNGPHSRAEYSFGEIASQAISTQGFNNLPEYELAMGEYPSCMRGSVV